MQKFTKIGNIKSVHADSILTQFSDKARDVSIIVARGCR